MAVRLRVLLDDVHHAGCRVCHYDVQDARDVDMRPANSRFKPGHVPVKRRQHDAKHDRIPYDTCFPCTDKLAAWTVQVLNFAFSCCFTEGKKPVHYRAPTPTSAALLMRIVQRRRRLAAWHSISSS